MRDKRSDDASGLKAMFDAIPTATPEDYATLFRFTDRLLSALGDREDQATFALYEEWVDRWTRLGTPDLGPQEPYPTETP